MIGRSLSEGYRSILPHGVYPAALLFIETPLEEVDVNVHPAKTEVRFRRQAAVADAVQRSGEECVGERRLRASRRTGEPVGRVYRSHRDGECKCWFERCRFQRSFSSGRSATTATTTYRLHARRS